MLISNVVRVSPSGSPRRTFVRGRMIFACALIAMSAAVCVSARASAPDPSSRDRSRGYLGIDLHDTPDEQINTYHLQGPHGAEITMVDHDGPAGKSGLQPHDIVLQVNGQNVDNADGLRRKIRESSPGTSVSLSIVRQGRAMTLTAKIANREEVERLAFEHMSLPESPQPTDDVQNVLVERNNSDSAPPRSHGQSFIGTVLRSGPYTGALLEPMLPQLADYFGAPPKTGLLVAGVDADSPASAAGLRAGDVILRVDAAPVASNSEWTKRLKAGNGHAVNLTILRDKHEETLTMQSDLKKHSLLEWPKLF